MSPFRSVLRVAVLLAAFGVVGASLVAITYESTKARIAENERQALLKKLHAILPEDRYDNDLLKDTVKVTAPDFLGTDEPVTVYRARKQGKPVAVLFTVVAPDGYGGPIKLLVGIYADGTLAGVRVLSHKETPGLGDAIDERRSDWILRFTGLSLKNPPPEQWKVRKDGGAFDQFTGATITPRAVVKAVFKALQYYQYHRDALWQ
ncbi:MAG: electron transport complex subunit RsxG [Gammaproteobacteria bacterium]|nr:MAG: electron transport complex subunit RsxG [Gammaproteobacteria bacterium]